MEQNTQNILRLEEKVDKGFARLDIKIDSLLKLWCQHDLEVNAKNTEIEAKLLVLDNDSKEYKQAKGFFQSKVVDFGMKLILAAIIVLLGFKEVGAKILSLF